jgi:hypothetical protein
MGTYHVELSGAMSLLKQSKAIEGEEALGTQFVSSRLWVNAKNVLTNLAEFKELDEAPDPPLGVPTLKRDLAQGDAPAWAGPMIVSGSAVHQVYLVRAQPA